MLLFFYLRAALMQMTRTTVAMGMQTWLTGPSFASQPKHSEPVTAHANAWLSTVKGDGPVHVGCREHQIAPIWPHSLFLTTLLSFFFFFFNQPYAVYRSRNARVSPRSRSLCPLLQIHHLLPCFLSLPPSPTSPTSAWQQGGLFFFFFFSSQ